MSETSGAITKDLTSEAAGRRMRPGLLVVLLSLLMGVQPVTTDLYLPALPALTEAFGAPVAQAHLTLTAMLLAFGCSQLIWGPLSDRFGRRPVLLLGTFAYTIAAVGCVLSPSMSALVGWRIVQGAAMGAAVVCARAVVRDLSSQQGGARTMSLALTGLGVIACLASVLGGVLADAWGWRVAMASTALFGMAVLLCVALFFVETLPAQRRAPIDAVALLRHWAVIGSHPGFLLSAALTAATFCGCLMFLAASSFVYQQLFGFSRSQYGLVLFSISAVFIAGTFLCRRLLARLGLRRTVVVGGALSLLGGSGVGVLAWAGVHTWWAVLLPFWLYMLGHGIHQPCGQSGAIAPFPRAAGTASALSGFLMMACAFLVGGWVGRHMDASLFVLAYGVWFWSACIALVAWTGMRKYSEPHPSTA